MKALILVVLTSIASQISAQDVTQYFHAVHNAIPSDTAFNQTIDNLWAHTVEMQQASGDSILDLKKNYAERLYRYYENHPNELTAEKAALYHFFILNMVDDHAKILSRFPDNRFSDNLWIAVFPIYRRAFLAVNQDDMGLLFANLQGIQSELEEPYIRQFLSRILGLEVGDQAPPIHKLDLDGQAVVLKGRVVLVDFWATWCKPCIAALPKMESLYERFGQRSNFLILGISRDKQEQTLRAYLDQHHLPWRHIFDGLRQEGDIAGQWQINFIPRYLLLDRQGTVRYSSHELDEPILVEMIEALLRR